MAAQSYEVRKARTDEQSVLVTFLEQYYFRRECVTTLYLNKHKHRIDEVELKNIEDDVRSMYTIIVANMPCLVAVEKESNEIVGLTLLLVEESPYFHQITASDQLSVQICPIKSLLHPYKSKLLDEIATHVVTAAYDSADLFAKFPLQRTALKLIFLCVNPEHCGRGLAKKLVEEAVNYAKREGIGFIYGLFSSPFSRKAAEKNGFETFIDVDILNCRDSDGNAIFEGEESHIITVMAKQIQPVHK